MNMMAKPNQDFAEFISNENGEFRMRLGHSVYVKKGTDIFRESKTGQLFLVSDAELVAKPWICKNLEREAAFQKRKAKAVLFSQPCFQRDRYSANQRISYNNARFN